MELLGLLGRIALVFGLLALTLWVVRRTDGGRRLRRADPTMEVLSSTRLAKGSSVALVRVGESTYVVGVTEHAVTLLTQADLPGTPATGSTAPAALPVTAADGPAPAPSFAEALQASTAQLLLRRHRAGSAGRHGAARAAVAPADTFTGSAASADPTSEPRQTAPAGEHTTRVVGEVADGPADPPPTTSPLPAPSGSTVVDLSRDAPDELLEHPCPPPRRARRAAHARGRRAGD